MTQIMTFQEYHYYSDIALKLFDFMNGRINIINTKCYLYIDMYDYVNNTKANIRYPNFITIYIGSIVDSWQDSWSTYISRESFIVSNIAWALSHELHHSDQFLSMIRYNSNEEYKRKVETEVEQASYDWVKNHSRILSEISGVEIKMECIYSPDLTDNRCYKKASVAEFYKQTIANILIRDFNLYHNLKIFTDDTLVDDIIIIFININEKIVIKSSGKYLKENIIKFSDIVYKCAGYYDSYNLEVNMDIIEHDIRKIGIVQFNISNNLIKPMIFG